MTARAHDLKSGCGNPIQEPDTHPGIAEEAPSRFHQHDLDFDQSID
jgi:hypothetical protein